MLPGANPRVKEAAAKAACNHEEIISAVHRFEGGPGVSGSGPGTGLEASCGGVACRRARLTERASGVPEVEGA